MDTQTEQSAANITAGLLNRAAVAADFGWSERTIIRNEHAGMPVIRLGRLRLYNPTTVRAWLMAHERGHAEIKRGRPAGKAA